MISKLLPKPINSVGFSRYRLIQISLHHGDATHEILSDDVGELKETLNTPVQDLLVWSLGPLDKLEDGDGELGSHVVVDLQCDKCVFRARAANTIMMVYMS